MNMALTDPSWSKELSEEFQKPYMKDLINFLENEYAQDKKIYPPQSEIFSALNLTPLNKVKVVVLGQDPYHGPGQAHGFSFSVKEGVTYPPSLKNIFTELKSCYGFEKIKNGNLTPWAKQGVLLLNAVLTVEEGHAGSHQNKGWEKFTDKIIEILNSKREGLVYILWGAYAQKKASFIDVKKNLILSSPHPSPLSSYRGFFGSKPFLKVNAYLEKSGDKPIDWAL
jgi:uracil-DNA glycosylase